MNVVRFSLLAAAALSFASILPAEDKITIRPHYESGKVYAMENDMEITSAMPAAGGGGNQQTTIVQNLLITVKDDAGTPNRLAAVKFAAIKATMNMMGQTMSYDSADTAKSQPFLQQAFGAMVGKEFTLVYDKDDKITDARGFESIAAAPLGGAKGMDGKQLVEAFKKSQEMLLPPQPVATGDTWNIDDQIDMQPIGTLHIKGSGKFDGIVAADGHKHAKLTVTCALTMPENPTNPMFKISDGSTINAEILYDLDRHVVDTTSVSEIKLNAAGQDLPMKHKTVTKITSITDVPVLK